MKPVPLRPLRVPLLAAVLLLSHGTAGTRGATTDGAPPPTPPRSADTNSVTPGPGEDGALLDLGGWRFRQPVTLTQPGVQQLRLDLEVLARARADLGDVRLVRGGRQVPYLRAPYTGTQPVRVTVTNLPVADLPRVSRWQIRLPGTSLPVVRLSVSSPAPLFQRHFELYEELRDGRTGLHRRPLGAMGWTRRPGQPVVPLIIELGGTPLGDTLLLETDNGDNPPVPLDGFEVAALAPRLWFTVSGTGEILHLYFGNPSATVPAYDLSLVADSLQKAPKAEAKSGALEELPQGLDWRWPGGEGGHPLFWVFLAGVAAVLVWLILRLLPAPPPSGTTPGGPGTS